jgi:uncharacterized membrane protein
MDGTGSAEQRPPQQEALAPGGVELLISKLLRSGVALSLSLVLAGMALSFFHHPDYLDSPGALAALVSPDDGPRSLQVVLRNARDVRGQAFVMLGLLVTMAVPFLRVVITLTTFRQQRDHAFVRFTSVVLVLLALSFLLGRVTD